MGVVGYISVEDNFLHKKWGGGRLLPETGLQEALNAWQVRPTEVWTQSSGLFHRVDLSAQALGRLV